MKNIVEVGAGNNKEPKEIKNLSKTELDKMAELFPGLIYVNDFREMRTISACKNTVEFTGYDEEKINRLGKDFFNQVIHPDDHHLLKNANEYFQRFKPVSVFSYICRIKHKDGTWRWMYNNAKVLTYTSEGMPWYTLGFAHDTSTLIDKKNFEKILSDREYRKKNVTRFKNLTKREIEILCLIADGLKNYEIGDKLFISPQTVETHRKNLIKKLGVSSFVELARLADLFCKR